VTASEDLQHLVLTKLRARFTDDVRGAHAFRGDLTAEVAPARLVEICRYLRDDAELAFDFLVDITAVDYIGTTPRFELVYHLKSLTRGHRLRLKTRVSEDDPRIETLVGVWRGADWLERETWDMYGIRFDGHPDLRRIYLYEEFEGHPLRKDYPKERRQPLVSRADLDTPQVQRQEERDRARYGRWH
jgi:NADH-quinone oxidoreductase subunit C